jgi:hypothetical protein
MTINNWTNPSTKGIAVVPDTDLAREVEDYPYPRDSDRERDYPGYPYPRGLFIGSGGVLVVEDRDGDEATYDEVLTGMYYPFSVVKVLGASTASNIMALY